MSVEPTDRLTAPKARLSTARGASAAPYILVSFAPALRPAYIHSHTCVCMYISVCMLARTAVRLPFSLLSLPLAYMLRTAGFSQCPYTDIAVYLYVYTLPYVCAPLAGPLTRSRTSPRESFARACTSRSLFGEEKLVLHRARAGSAERSSSSSLKNPYPVRYAATAAPTQPGTHNRGSFTKVLYVCVYTCA